MEVGERKGKEKALCLKSWMQQTPGDHSRALDGAEAQNGNGTSKLHYKKKNEICSGSKIITLSNYERHLSFLSVSETIMREDSYMVVTLQGCGGVG